MVSLKNLLSCDYLNEYVPLLTPDSLELVLDDFRIKKFWERYSKDGDNSRVIEYLPELTILEKETINRLDDLADKTNLVLDTKPLDYSKLINLTDEAIELCREH